jgi:hypothetical protein
MIEGGMNGRRQRQRAASRLTTLGWACLAIFVLMIGLIGAAALKGYY